MVEEEERKTSSLTLDEREEQRPDHEAEARKEGKRINDNALQEGPRRAHEHHMRANRKTTIQ